MSLKVLKYPVNSRQILGNQHSIIKGSKFLSLQMQDGEPMMWWLCNEDTLDPNWYTLKTFFVVGTGMGVSDHLYYVGTYQDGGFVGHVFCDTSEGLL